MKRPWTNIDRQYVRDHTPGNTKAVARHLGRSVQSVYLARLGMGLARRIAPRGAALERYVRARHAEGWSDGEIAAGWSAMHPGCMPVERHGIGMLRNRLGLAHNTSSDRRRQKVRERTAAQLKAAGLPSIGYLRVAAFRRRAREAGWPEDLRPRAVQMLNAMWDRGPMTRKEISDAIGLAWHGSRGSLHSRDPEGTYLANLMKRGLVVRFDRAGKVTGQGKGRSVSVYSLAPDIERKAV